MLGTMPGREKESNRCELRLDYGAEFICWLVPFCKITLEFLKIYLHFNTRRWDRVHLAYVSQKSI